MGRGSQLVDLFEALPPEEANREYATEVAAMKNLCLAILGRERLVA